MKHLLVYRRLACFLCILFVMLNATSTGLAFMHSQPANEVEIVQDQLASSTEPGETAWIILLDGDPVSAFRQRLSVGKNALSQMQKNQVAAYDQQLAAAQRGLVQAARQQGLQVTVRRNFRYLLNGVAVSTDARNVDRLSFLPGVKGIYPDSPVHIELADSVSLIGADQVWQMQDAGGLPVTGQGMRVAVIDTGIDYTHPDLGGCFGPSCKVAGGYDLYNNDANPIDDNGHGTHCAGIVAANGTVKGVAPGASLYAYKVLNSSGFGSVSVIIAGIERAADPDQDPATADAVDVISMSLGLTGTPDDPWPLAVDAAVQQGIFVAVSAGNSGPNYYTVESPGVAQRATSVGASDKTDVIASFSSRGPLPGYDGWLKPNLLAPGVDIISTYLGGTYATSSGTSMAAPHVAGAAALVRQMHPGWNPEQVQSSLMNTAVDLGYNVHTQGAGRVQVNQAVTAAGLVTPASVSFGTVDPSQPLWSDTRLLWLENVTSTEHSYSLSVEASLPAGVTVSVYPTTITLAQGAKRSFSVVLAVDTLQTPPDLERNEGSIHIQQGGQILTVPFAFMMQPVFIENRLLPFGLQTSYSVALEDLDGDGDLDAFVGNTSYYDNPANTVWFNDGNGNFTDSGQRLGSVFTWDVALGDLDGDGDLDAFAANSEPTSARPDEVWLNNGHGIFTDSGQRLGSTLSRAVALGDLDGDGDLDAFVANGVSDRGQPEADRVWLNNGQGVFSDSGQQLGNSSGLDVALGDLDGDGDLDAFIANGDPLRILNDPNEVWLNNGHAVFSNSGQNIGNAISQAVALGDLDSDGDLDAFIANGGPNVLDAQPDEVWWNNGGQFTISGQSLGKQSSYGAALADIHKDGTLDVVVAGYQGGNTLWINDGEGKLTLSSPAFGAEYSTDVALGDVDDDGDIDALFANGMSKPNRLWLNRGSGGPALDQLVPPSDLTAAALSTTSIALNWIENATGETSYRVERSPDGSTGWLEIAIQPAGSSSFTDSSVYCSQSTYYRVRAYREDAGIYSAYSNIASATTWQCGTGSPGELITSDIDQNEIRLSWQDNATDESEYRVERSPNGNTSWAEIAIMPANTSSYLDSGLACGTTYFYRVRAYRAIDGQFSAYSNIADDSTYLCDVLAPSNLTAIVQSQTPINLSWIDNASDESEYHVERSPDGVSSWSQLIVLPAGSTSYTDSALSCATQYTYRVRAYRNVDAQFSAYSNNTSATTNLCSVSAPDELSAVTVSQTQIHLTWLDRSSDETNYRVEHSPDGLIGWAQQAVLPAGSENYDDTSLVCDTRYYYRVRAYRVSDTQFSEYSNIANAQTKLCPVAAPGNLTAVALSPSQINLTWHDQATDETDYRIERSPDGIIDWFPLDVVPAESINYADTSATCSTTYYYRVRAYRAVDQQFSIYSMVAQATSHHCGLIPPAGLTASLITSTEIHLTWQETVTGEVVHLIERSLNGDAGWLQVAALPAGSNNYKDTGLLCRTRYFYRIRTYRPTDFQYSDYSSIIELETTECFAKVYLPFIIK